MSRFTSAPEPVVDYLYAVTPCVYLMVNPDFGGTTADPGVGAVMWARNRKSALRIYERRLDNDSEDGVFCDLPPTEVMGFQPVTFGTALRYEKGRGERPMQTADYRFTDGKFVASRLCVTTRDLVFSSINPPDGEEPIGVIFRLEET